MINKEIHEIGFVGYPRVGKDTLARVIQEKEPGRWKALAFADPMKELAVKLFHYDSVEHLEECKSGVYGPIEADNTRIILQNLGQSLRDLDPDFWVRLFEYRAQDMAASDIDRVVTDIRYDNEFQSVDHGGTESVIVAITRPGYEMVNDHQSERNTEELIKKADFMIINDGTPEDLYEKLVDCLGEY